MADRFVVSEVQQIGIESVAGTGVTPTLQFAGVNIDLDTAMEFDEFKPMGQLVQSIVAPRREWATGSLSGFPNYNELAYVLANIFGAATITTPSGATLARQWQWTPDKATPWTPKTWTIRRGDSTTAEEATYGLLSGLTLGFSRTAAPTMSGDLFARRLDYTASLVAATGVTTPSVQPILPDQIDVYLDSTGAGLGGTQLLRDFNYEWSISGLFGNIWPLNSSNTSFAAHSIQAPEVSATLQVGNDTAGRALVTNMRAGSSVFVRLKAQGAASSIESGQRYSLTIDTALKVMDAPSRADVDGLATLEWSLRGVYDATWAKWAQITLVCTPTGL
jgi:hypothetical protein